MKLHLKYLKQALETAQSDRKKINDALEYYIHTDLNSQQHIRDCLRIHKENPNFICDKGKELVDLDFAINDLKNLIWREER